MFILTCQAWSEMACDHTLRPANTCYAKYVSNIMPGRFYNFSICLSNKSAKKTAKAQHKTLYILNGVVLVSLLSTYSTPCSCVSFVYFEQVNEG